MNFTYKKEVIPKLTRANFKPGWLYRGYLNGRLYLALEDGNIVDIRDNALVFDIGGEFVEIGEAEISA